MATNINVDKIKLKNPPKKLKSKVWEHFGFREGQDTDKATCKICFTDVSYPKSCSTSNLMQHMKRKHDVDLFGKLYPCPGLPEISLISTTVSRHIWD